MALQACGLADSATAFARLGHPETAYRELGHSRELWIPRGSGGDLDRPAALLELDRGRLDAAEQFAASSVRHWEGVSHLGRTSSRIVLATIHVRVGEPDVSGWRTTPSPQRASSPPYAPAPGSNRWQPRWTPGPVVM
ncbi:MAG: hypothetical protein ACRDSN_00690, partial [Pseudonocardiaceae bacterium]